MEPIRSVIVATGSYLPENKISNSEFSSHVFLEKNGLPFSGSNDRIIDKFHEITGIQERRYARPEQKASDLACLAAQDALQSGGIDPETLDYIIVAHNFGDVTFGSNRTDLVPSLASRVKFLLQIKNPSCVAYDLVFGCPGWVQGLIQADYYIRSGDAWRCLVIGTETLSRVIDDHDRDSMIYADGAGAVIVEASQNSTSGIITHLTQTFAGEHARLLKMDKSYNPEKKDGDIFIKMNGRSLYEFALHYVPQVIKQTLDKGKVNLVDISKILIHQANQKMDHAILKRLFKLYNLDNYPTDIMPMSIGLLGNSSVATIPTLMDLIQKGKMKDHQLLTGDKIVLASVGAGMSINAMLYQF
ncbi:ketoacyl-ACP synthase III [Puia sp.]|uniref:3-oxoacyl-ACP synthase III family protein n=1 Tax=Puia sp. TaxID=2045100 RepID=UPI002F40DCA5